VIQANANVALLQASQDSSFDYWLRLSTWDHGQPVWLPVHLAAYQRQVLAGKTLNTSTTLTRKQDGWWLTLSSDEQVPVESPTAAPVIGREVGIANFLTTSTGKQYGTFPGKLAERHKRARQKRRRKAKLRACLNRSQECHRCHPVARQNQPNQQPFAAGSAGRARMPTGTRQRS